MPPLRKKQRLLPKPPSTKLDWKAQKEEQRLRKKENELKKTEKRIEELDTIRKLMRKCRNRKSQRMSV